MNIMNLSNQFLRAIEATNTEHVKKTATALYAVMFGTIDEIDGTAHEIIFHLSNGARITVHS